MYKLVLIRHGESVWNMENRFTGWTDVDLSEKGEHEAKVAGRILGALGFSFDDVFTSLLKRATRTMDIILEQLSQGSKDYLEPTIHRSWKLNERHYGALQALNKAETAEKFGEEQVHIWRRSYDTPPPALTLDDPRYPGNDVAYKDFAKEDLPLTESLKDTVVRVIPYYETEILPLMKAGKKVMIVAHGNSLRGLVKHLDKISDSEITELNIPTGVALVYEFDENFQPTRHYYLDDKVA